MTFTLTADEFGLLHAAVPHPCKPQYNIQVMVLQAEDGWWCYVDGERVNGSFQSSRHAGQAAASEIDKLRLLAEDAATGQELMRERALSEPKPTFLSTSKRRKTTPQVLRSTARVSGTAIAACVAIMFLAFTGYVVHATGVLATDDVELALAPTDHDAFDTAVPVAAEPVPPKITSAAAAHMTAVEASEPVKVEAPAVLQPAPGRKTSVPKLPRTRTITRPAPATPPLQPVRAAPTRYNVDRPNLLPRRTRASIRSAATENLENAVVPAVSPRQTRVRRPRVRQPRLRQPRRTVSPKRTSRRKINRSRAVSKRRARRVRRNSRSRTASRSRQARLRPSRRATRRAIRRARARKVRRVYRDAFGRTSLR